MESESPLSPAAATAWQTIRELATLDGKLIHPSSLHIDNNGTNIYVTGGEGLYMLMKLCVDGWYDDNVESITVRNSKQLFDKELFKQVQPHLPQGAIVEFNGEVIQPASGEECEQGGKAQRNGKAKRLKRRKDTKPYNKNVLTKEPFACPITLDTMTDPVVLGCDGRTYERKAIETWMHMNNTSPWTRAEITEASLTENLVILEHNREADPGAFEELDKQREEAAAAAAKAKKNRYELHVMLANSDIFSYLQRDHLMEVISRSWWNSKECDDFYRPNRVRFSFLEIAGDAGLCHRFVHDFFPKALIASFQLFSDRWAVRNTIKSEFQRDMLEKARKIWEAKKLDHEAAAQRCAKQPQQQPRYSH
jgi:hypothetical protein